MSFSDDWAELLTWTVQMKKPDGIDANGNKQWTDPVEVAAHVDQITLTERSKNEREGIEATERTIGTIYWGADTGFEPVPGTRCTMPYGAELDIRQFITHYDDDGLIHHYEANLEEAD